jgi:hypothetical protein
MTVERSQEAVEAALKAHASAFDNVSGRGWSPDDAATWMRAALAAADAADPVIRVADLLSDKTIREVAYDMLTGPYCEDYPCRGDKQCDCRDSVTATLHRAVSLLDEHANERTDT